MTPSPCMSCVDTSTPCPCPTRLQWEAVTYPDKPAEPPCPTCEDTEWLALSGEQPDQIAARLGYSDRGHLYSHLIRHGTRHLIANGRNG